MNLSAILMSLNDLLCIALLFYLLPNSILSYARNRSSHDAPRAFKFLLDQIPGFLFGTAVAVAFLYFFNASYETFVLNATRDIVDAARSIIGVDAVLVCATRFMEENDVTQATLFDAYNSIQWAPTITSELEYLQLYMIDLESNLEVGEHPADGVVRLYCEAKQLR